MTTHSTIFVRTCISFVFLSSLINFYFRGPQIFQNSRRHCTNLVARSTWRQVFLQLCLISLLRMAHKASFYFSSLYVAISMNVTPTSRTSHFPPCYPVGNFPTGFPINILRNYSLPRSSYMLSHSFSDLPNYPGLYNNFLLSRSI